MRLEQRTQGKGSLRANAGLSRSGSSCKHAQGTSDGNTLPTLLTQNCTRWASREQFGWRSHRRQLQARTQTGALNKPDSSLRMTGRLHSDGSSRRSSAEAMPMSLPTLSNLADPAAPIIQALCSSPLRPSQGPVHGALRRVTPQHPGSTERAYLNLSEERYTRPGRMRDGSVLAMSLKLTPCSMLCISAPFKSPDEWCACTSCWQGKQSELWGCRRYARGARAYDG